MKRSWWLNESVYVGPEHLDTDYVDGYEEKAGYDAASDIDALLAHGIMPDATVVDLGAGTGVFAAAAAKRFARVIAVDVSPAMTRAMQRKVAVEELHNVAVVEAGFLSYNHAEHADTPADAVFTRNALHQLPDFWKVLALQRMADLLRPGGVLRLRDLVFDFEPATAPDDIDAWIAGAPITDPSKGYTSADLETHVETEFSTFRWLFETMLARTGFEILEAEYVRGTYAAYTCRRR